MTRASERLTSLVDQLLGQWYELTEADRERLGAVLFADKQRCPECGVKLFALEENVSGTLRTLRLRADLSVEDAAIKAGISFRTVEAAESPEYGIPREVTIRKLMFVYGVSDPAEIEHVVELAHPTRRRQT